MPLGQTLSGLLPLAGTAIGSAWGPAGTAIGGALGQVGQNLLGDYYKQQSPAEQARAQLMQQLQGATPYQRVDFTPIANEEVRRFQQDVLPGIANQFAGMGGLQSSAYRQALSGAGQDLQTRLAALRAQHELGQNQFMSGAEERRRQMLANLAGGVVGEEQSRDFGRQQMMGNMLGSVPGFMLSNAQLENQRKYGALGQLLSGLGQQQGIRQSNVGQAVSASQPVLGRLFENLIRQDPTGGQQALRTMLELLGAGANVAGQVGSAALMGRG